MGTEWEMDKIVDGDREVKTSGYKTNMSSRQKVRHGEYSQ